MEMRTLGRYEILAELVLVQLCHQPAGVTTISECQLPLVNAFERGTAAAEDRERFSRTGRPAPRTFRPRCRSRCLRPEAARHADVELGPTRR